MEVKMHRKKKPINNSKRKSQITYEIIPNRIRLDFSKETKILKTLETLKKSETTAHSTISKKTLNCH